MRSWLAQSLRVLEDMVDSGELTEDELRALAKNALVPSVATLPPPPPRFDGSGLPMVDEEEESTRGTPDETGVHSARPAPSAPAAAKPAPHRSGTMPRVDVAKTGTKK